MKHTVNKLENSVVELLINFDENEWKTANHKAFEKLAKNVEVPGFRKGNAPAHLVKAKIDQSKMFNTAIDSLLPDAYSKIISEEKIVPWARPKVEIMKVSDVELEVKITVMTAPEVTLGQYKGHKIEKAKVKITAKDIDEEIKRLQEQNAELVVTDQPAKVGDTVVFDFEGFVDGKTFEGGKAENYALELGSGQFIPGFEEALVGVKAGDKKDVNVTFPKQYSENLAGKDATFKTVIHEVKQKKVPEIGQALFEELKISEVTSLDSLKEHVKGELEKKQQQQIDKDYYEALVKKIRDEAKVDIAHEIIHEEMHAMKENLLKQVEQNGMTFEKYLEMSGQKTEEFDAKLHEDAERNIKSALVLEKIAEVEDIKVSPEIIDFEMAKIADQYKMEFDKVKEILSKDMNRFVADVKSRHIHDFLISNND
jgi:trigger factor